MKIEDYVAVSGLPGLFKMVVNRGNGLIVEEIDSGKRKFAPARKHQFTPLASIGIYNETDTTELKVVFKSMLEKIEETPLVSPNAPSNKLIEYFGIVFPEFDRDRVHISDIKKIIKWFNFLNERNLLSLEEEEEPKEEDAASKTEESPEATDTEVLDKK